MNELDGELDGIWVATLRRQRHDRIESVVIGLVALASASVMVLGLAYLLGDLP